MFADAQYVLVQAVFTMHPQHFMHFQSQDTQKHLERHYCFGLIVNLFLYHKCVTRSSNI